MYQNKLCNKQKTKSIYQLTDEEVGLFYIVEGNLNQDIGYRAYYQLQKSINNRHGNTDVLLDLAMDFDWDDKLDNALGILVAEDE